MKNLLMPRYRVRRVTDLKADELKEKDEAKAAQCCLETSEKADEEEQG